MNIHGAKHRQDSGFTLIELLVVIAIIAISFTTLVTLTVFSSTPHDRLHDQALKLQNLLRFAHEQAVVRGEEYGLLFTETGYRFLHLNGDNWAFITKDKFLRDHQLEDGFQIELALDGIDVSLQHSNDDTDIDTEDAQELGKLRPQIFLLSSSETTPAFEVRLRLVGEDDSILVDGNVNGQYVLKDG